MPLINLKSQYGDRYRVVDDGTDDRDRAERVWCMEIRGKYGAIYPHGADGTLAVRVESARVARRFTSLALKVAQRGDDEVVFVFTADLIDKVGALIRARRRRQVSPERRAQLAEGLKRARERAGRPDSTVVSPCEREGSGA